MNSSNNTFICLVLNYIHEREKYLYIYLYLIRPGAEYIPQSQGSRDGAVVKALAFHQCGLGSIRGRDVICGLSL